MKQIRRFKLIKEFPGSPEKGHIATEDEFTFMSDYPEFWKEIKEYPKIISFRVFDTKEVFKLDSKDNLYHSSKGSCTRTLDDMLHGVTCIGSNNIEIYQIAKSENEAFTVGDEVIYITPEGKQLYETYKIEKFKLNNLGNFFVMFDFGAVSINNIKTKFKSKPLIITEDGVKVFNIGEVIFLVFKTNIITSKFSSLKYYTKEPKVFYFKQNAIDYIRHNKPIYSKEDVKKVITEVIAGLNCVTANQIINKIFEKLDKK